MNNYPRMTERRGDVSLAGSYDQSPHTEVHNFVKAWLGDHGHPSEPWKPSDILDQRHADEHMWIADLLRILAPWAPPAPVITDRIAPGVGPGHPERHLWELRIIRQLDTGARRR